MWKLFVLLIQEILFAIDMCVELLLNLAALCTYTGAGYMDYTYKKEEELVVWRHLNIGFMGKKTLCNLRGSTSLTSSRRRVCCWDGWGLTSSSGLWSSKTWCRWTASQGAQHRLHTQLNAPLFEEPVCLAWCCSQTKCKYFPSGCCWWCRN